MGFFFFFNDTATTEIYTLSLHDALPIYPRTLDVDRAMLEAAGVEALFLPNASEMYPDGDETIVETTRLAGVFHGRSEEHTSELQSRQYLVCRLLLEKKNIDQNHTRLNSR